MTRVQSDSSSQTVQLGLGALMALMAVMSIWLGWVVWSWTRHVNGIESALSGAGAAGIPALARTGEGELDRIVDALNDAGTRLIPTLVDPDSLVLPDAAFV